MFRNRYVISLFLVVLGVIVSVTALGEIIEFKLSSYVEGEVNRVAKILIRDVLDREFLNSLELNNLYIVEKNQNGDIQMIDFDMVKINEILGNINDEIIYYFNEFDSGNINLIYEAKLFNKTQNGMFIGVPLGIVFNNPLLSNVGPFVPIKLLFSGEVESNIVTGAKQYGINSILVEIDVEIVVKENIIFPFSSKNVDVWFDFPLVIELISGKVPENYLKS